LGLKGFVVVVVVVVRSKPIIIFFCSYAGYLLKKSAKTNGWSKRWFVLNEKSGKVNQFFKTFLLYS
jgi:hypothetical protein